MKRFLFLLAFTLCAVAARAAKPLVCTEKGTVMEMAHCDAEGTVMGYERTTVAAVERTPEGWTKVICRTAVLDKERKPLTVGENDKGLPDMEYTYLIRGSDMVRLMPLDLASLGIESEGVRMSVSGGEYTLPLEPVAGAVLPDVAMKFTVHVGEGHIPIKFKVTDRMVVARERIATPAGEFEAFKIAERVAVSVYIVSDSYHTESWYVPGIGLVRENRTTRRDRLESYAQLVSIAP